MNFDMHGFAELLAQRLPVRSDSPEGTEADQYLLPFASFTYHLLSYSR